MHKKFICSLFFILFIFVSGHAQLRLGPRLSGNYSNVTNLHSNSDLYLDSESRIGFQVGALAVIPLSNMNENLFLQPEINYSNQGEYFDYENKEEEKTRAKSFLNFINIPVQLKYYFNSYEKGFFVEGGPYIGFKLYDNLTYPDDVGDSDPEEGGDNEYHESYNTFDFGGIIGVGYSITRNLEVSARYARGLAQQEKNTSSTYNSVFNIGLTYIFDINTNRGCYF